MENPKAPPFTKPGEKNYIDPGAPNLIRLYSNAFRAGATMSDFYVIGTLNNSPAFVVNMSFETAKSLHSTLTALIDDFEKKAEMKIKTITEIHDLYKKNDPSSV
jgi:hypothetical protein